MNILKQWARYQYEQNENLILAFIAAFMGGAFVAGAIIGI